MPPPPAAPTSRKTFNVTKDNPPAGERIMLYGDGGLGKSTLASLLPDPVFLDVEASTRKLDVARVGGVETWADMLDALRDESLWKCKTVVVDSLTKAQELAVAHTLATVKHEKGQVVERIEDYGFGKGYRHVFDTFLPLLAVLDRHVNKGRNVCVIAHQTTEKAPNPEGEDYLRYEPALQQPPKEGRIRDRVVSWCDHVFFLQLDKFVKDNKAQGGGSRTVYPQGRPTFVAKSRSVEKAIPFSSKTDGSLWAAVFTK